MALARASATRADRKSGSAHAFCDMADLVARPSGVKAMAFAAADIFSSRFGFVAPARVAETTLDRYSGFCHKSRMLELTLSLSPGSRSYASRTRALTPAANDGSEAKACEFAVCLAIKAGSAALARDSAVRASRNPGWSHGFFRMG